MASLQIHAPVATASGAVFIPVCTISVGLRLYARKLKGAGFGADDWLIVGALLFTIGIGISMIHEVRLKHLGYPTPSAEDSLGKPNANLAFWPGEVLQVPAMGLVKLSILFFYRRIFTKGVARIFNIVSWVMILIIIAWTISFFFALVFICGTNFDAYWTTYATEKAYCVDTAKLHNSFAISDVITDFIIICLPMPMIRGLHLNTRRKLGLVAIFSMGALTIAASVMRMVVFVQATALDFDPSNDFNFICTAGLYWCMIEAGLGVLAACLPAQYGLFTSKGLQSIVNSFHSISARSLRHQFSSGSLRSQTQGTSPAASGEDGSPTEPWTGASDTQHITAHAGGVGENDTHLEEGIGRDIPVTNSFESRQKPTGVPHQAS